MHFTEPLTGVEPVTSSLPRKRSTTELQRLMSIIQRTFLHFKIKSAKIHYFF